MYRLHTPYQYKNIHKLYRSQLSRSKYSYKSQCTGEHQTQGGMGSPREHGTARVHPSMGGWQVTLLPQGVTSHPADSTGTWKLPWRQSGGARCKSALNAQPPPPLPDMGLGHSTPGGGLDVPREGGSVAWGCTSPPGPPGGSSTRRRQLSIAQYSPPGQRCRLPRRPPLLRWS